VVADLSPIRSPHGSSADGGSQAASQALLHLPDKRGIATGTAGACGVAQAAQLDRVLVAGQQLLPVGGVADLTPTRMSSSWLSSCPAVWAWALDQR
jgi:hypothetical protein